MSSTASLIDIKNQVHRVEKELKDLVKDISNKQQVQMGRCDDHGKRGFTVDIYYDEFNVDIFSDENVQKVRDVHRRFVELRRQQKALEEEYNTDKLIESTLKNDVRLGRA